MNLLFPLPDAREAEQVVTLLTRPGLRVERTVSLGQASPRGFWYDQEEGEWVLLLTGAAKLRFADEPEPRLLRPGDWLDIAPHRLHRVDWTDPATPTDGSPCSTDRRSRPAPIRLGPHARLL
jgi:cupin 2 domain-containing protein